MVSVGEDTMGNLGDYQRMTTLAKRVGGPKVLGLAATVLGYIVLRPAEAGLKKAARTFKERGGSHPLRGRVFRVTADGHDGHGVRLYEGDEYRVLEGDRDAILIEIIGGTSNPHVVAGEFLKTVSEFTEIRSE